jgi:predicted TIM-barrel fold metal-dependent hydrolase
MKHLSVRFFGLVLLTLGVFSSCHRAGAARENVSGHNMDLQNPLPSRVIDAHAHWDEKANGPSQAMLDEYEAAHVTGAVIHSWESLIPQLSGAEKTRFILCSGVIPPMSLAQAESLLTKGPFRCLKIFLGYVPKYANDPYYEPFFKLAARLNVPVVFHTGDVADPDALVKYADPLLIDEVAVAHRDVTFVIAHAGNPWIQSAGEVAYKNRNVVMDLSALMIGDLGSASPQSVEELVIRPIQWLGAYTEDWSKFLFGTDRPLTKVAPYIRLVMRAVPREHHAAVFYDNAARVFEFSGDAPKE